MIQRRKTTPQDRESHWADVEALISPGFLSETVVVGGVPFCVRNPNESDIWYLRQLHPRAESWADYSHEMISRCIWSVGDVVVLQDDQSRRDIRAALDDMVCSHVVWRELFFTVLGLFLRVRCAERDIYAYIYEDMSRLAWRGMPTLDFGNHYADLFGVHRLGTNMIQQVWVAYNKSEDSRIDDLNQWNFTKNIMACQAPKGVKKLDDKDRQNVEELLRDRQMRLDNFYYRSIGVLDEADKERVNEVDDGEAIHLATTAEELADEMHRWVTGKQDRHDKIVQAYKDGVRERMVQERRAREERLAKIRREQEIAAKTFGYDTSRPSVVGYSFDEVQEMMKKRGINIASPGARTIGYEPSRRERAFDRWIEKNPDSGNLVSDGVGLSAKSSASSETLQEQVSRRRPTLPDGGE